MLENVVKARMHYVVLALASGGDLMVDPATGPCSEDNTEADYMELGGRLGHDGLKRVALMVGSRVVEGCMECVDNLDDWAWAGSEGKDL